MPVISNFCSSTRGWRPLAARIRARSMGGFLKERFRQAPALIAIQDSIRLRACSSREKRSGSISFAKSCIGMERPSRPRRDR